MGRIWGRLNSLSRFSACGPVLAQAPNQNWARSEAKLWPRGGPDNFCYLGRIIRLKIGWIVSHGFKNRLKIENRLVCSQLNFTPEAHGDFSNCSLAPTVSLGHKYMNDISRTALRVTSWGILLLRLSKYSIISYTDRNVHSQATRQNKFGLTLRH